MPELSLREYVAGFLSVLTADEVDNMCHYYEMVRYLVECGYYPEDATLDELTRQIVANRKKGLTK